MRKLLFIGGLVLFAACNNHTVNNKAHPEDSTEAGVAYDLTPVWTYEYDSASREHHAKKLRELNPEETTEQTLVSILNTEWPDIQVAFKKVSNDTAYVAIPNSSVLTQTMGSTGATQYMAVATYTLTEMKGIRYVHFDFTEGDHAEPGTYGRQQFENGF